MDKAEATKTFSMATEVWPSTNQTNPIHEHLGLLLEPLRHHGLDVFTLSESIDC
jgi:hypothetical protein